MTPAPALDDILPDMDAAITAATNSPLGTVCIDEDGELVTDGRYLVLATVTRVVSWPRFKVEVASQDVVTIHVVRPLAPPTPGALPDQTA